MRRFEWSRVLIVLLVAALLSLGGCGGGGGGDKGGGKPTPTPDPRGYRLEDFRGEWRQRMRRGPSSWMGARSPWRGRTFE